MNEVVQKEEEEERGLGVMTGEQCGGLSFNKSCSYFCKRAWGVLPQRLENRENC
jgi:hypothetical protein